MEVIEIDVMDGRGVIAIAVGDYIEALRLRRYVKEAAKAIEGAQDDAGLLGDSPVPELSIRSK